MELLIDPQSFILCKLESVTFPISAEVHRSLRDPVARRAAELKFQALRIKPELDVQGHWATVEAYHDQAMHAINVLQQGLTAVEGAAPTPPRTLSSQDMTEVVLEYHICHPQTALITEELIGDLHEALGTQIVLANRHDNAPAAVLIHGYVECVALAWQAVDRVVKANDKQCNGKAVGRVLICHQGVPHHPRDLPLGPIWLDPSRFTVRRGVHWVGFTTSPAAPPLPAPFPSVHGPPLPPPPFHPQPYMPMPPRPSLYASPYGPMFPPPPLALPYGYPTGGWPVASDLGPGSAAFNQASEPLAPRSLAGSFPRGPAVRETRKPAEKRKGRQHDQAEAQSQPASSKVYKVGSLEDGMAGVDLDKDTRQKGGSSDTKQVTSSTPAPASSPKTGVELLLGGYRPPDATDSPSSKAARPNTQGPRAGARVLDMPMARTQWYQTTTGAKPTKGGVSGGPIEVTVGLNARDAHADNPPSSGPAPSLPAPELSEDVLAARLWLAQEATTRGHDGLYFVPAMTALTSDKGAEPNEPVGCICTVLSPPHEPSEEGLLLLGVQRDNCESTCRSYDVVLAFFKATHHLFLEAGMTKRPGFDLFRPNQSIILSLMDYKTESLTGASATSAALLALCVRFFDCKMRRETAVTGHVGLNGDLRAVGAVDAKVRGARAMGYDRMVIPHSCLDQLGAECRAYTDIQILTARNVFELLNHCLEGFQLPPAICERFAALLPCTYVPCGGDVFGAVTACVYPGTGNLVITGAEPTDREHWRAQAHYTAPRRDAALSAAKAALVWLQHVEQQEHEDWIHDLPEGEQTFGLHWRELTDGDAEVRKMDVHLDLPPHGGQPCGAAVVLTLMQLMRGQCLRGKVAAVGALTPTGSLVPAPPPPPVTSSMVKTYLYPEIEEVMYEKPQVPPGVSLRGFDNIRDMVKYAFTI